MTTDTTTEAVERLAEWAGCQSDIAAVWSDATANELRSVNATLRALAAERDAAVDAAAVLAPGAEAMRAAFAEAMGMHSDATELLAKAIAERDRYKRLAYNAQDVRDRATSERSAAEAERDAALAREARMREAGEQLMNAASALIDLDISPARDGRTAHCIAQMRAALSEAPR